MTIRVVAVAAMVLGCRTAQEAVEQQGGPGPVICIRKESLDVCRDKAGQFWICDGIKPARCLRTTEPNDVFAIKPQQAEATP